MKLNLPLFLLLILPAIHLGNAADHASDLAFEKHFLMGNEYFSKNQLDKAVIEFSSALKVNPLSGEAHYALAHTYLEQWRISFEAASRKYLEAMGSNPKAVPKAALHGNYEFYGEKRELRALAMKEFKETIKIDPTNWGAWYYIGTDHLNQGDYDEAIKECEQVTKLNPKYSNGYACMGSAYYRKGLYRLAIKRYKEAIAIEPDFENAHYELGLTYLKVDNKKEAIEELKKLKNMNSIYYERLKNEIY